MWTSTCNNLALEGLWLTAFGLWISWTNAHKCFDRLSFTNGCFRQWRYWSTFTDALSKKFIGSNLAKEEMNSTMTYFISLEQLPYVAWLLTCYWKEFKKYYTILELLFTNIVVLQSIKLSEYVRHIVTWRVLHTCTFLIIS